MKGLNELLQEMIRLFEEVISLEMEKTEAIRKRRITMLESCMKREQVMTLQFRSCEKKLQDILDKYGEKDITLKEILSKLREPEKSQTKQLYVRLQECVIHFREINETAAELLKVQLYKTEKQMEAAGIYNKAGKEIKEKDSFRVRKA